MRPTARPAASRATSGFPSPAEDVAEASLDLQALLAPRPAATFFLRMRGEAMRGAGVFAGDLLVVDRSLRPTPRRLVVLAVGGELLVRRYVRAVASHGTLFIAAGDGVSEAVPLGELGEGADPTLAAIWGVVTYVIHPADALAGGLGGLGGVEDARYAAAQDVQ